MASPVRPDRSHSCVVMPKLKNGKYPVGLDLEQRAKKVRRETEEQLQDDLQTALVRKRNPNEQKKNLRIAEVFFFSG